MVEWAPVEGAATNLLVLAYPPPDTTTLLVARYLLIKTLVARQLHTPKYQHRKIYNVMRCVYIYILLYKRMYSVYTSSAIPLSALLVNGVVSSISVHYTEKVWLQCSGIESFVALSNPSKLSTHCYT